MSASDLSIILLTKNGGALFREVLGGLFSCSGIAQAEVLMIDSGSADETLRHAADFPQIRVHRIPQAEFGHGKTRNLGARLTSRPVLVYLVQDATPIGADFLARLSAPLAEPGVAAAFGRQLPRPATNRVEKLFLHATYPERRQVRSYTGAGPLRIADIFFSNVCSALRREVWQRIPFDETLIMSEDQMWARQALRAGHRIVYEPAARVYHSHDYPLGEVFRRNFDSGVSLRGIAEDSLGDLAAAELRFVVDGAVQLARGGEARLLPYFLAYEATRAGGALCGGQAHRLPLWLRKALSLHRYHWDR